KGPTAATEDWEGSHAIVADALSPCADLAAPFPLTPTSPVSSSPRHRFIRGPAEGEAGDTNARLIDSSEVRLLAPHQS
ncbi:unnamed protein product, partial [Urochloa humidicola]